MRYAISSSVKAHCAFNFKQARALWSNAKRIMQLRVKPKRPLGPTLAKQLLVLPVLSYIPLAKEP